MKKIISLLLTLVILTGFLILQSNFVKAEGPTLDDPLNLKGKDLIEVNLRIMQAVLGGVGLVALFMFILGGFEFLTSGGNQNMIKRGKDTLIWATIGMLVIILSYSILKFLFDKLAGLSK